MSYEKQNWDNTTPATPTRMNHIEDGIKDLYDSFLDKCYPIGTYYETSSEQFDPNISFYGTWEEDTSGTVLASRSTTSGSALNVAIGTVVGEEKHTLNINEMPNHNHPLNGYYGNENGAYYIKSGNNTGTLADIQTGYIGGGQAHNNMQPTKIIKIW